MINMGVGGASPSFDPWWPGSGGGSSCRPASPRAEAATSPDRPVNTACAKSATASAIGSAWPRRSIGVSPPPGASSRHQVARGHAGQTEARRTKELVKHICVELERAVVKEAAEALPVPQAVADCRGERRALADAPELGVEPEAEIAHEWRAALLPNGLAFVGRTAADLALDGVERADAQQSLGGDRRGGVGVDLVEAPTQMRPTEGKRDRAVVAPIGQCTEAAIAVHLQRATEGREMPGGPDAAA